MSTPASSSSTPVNRHALTPVEKQRSQLEKLLKDPAKPVYVPPPPKEKNIRPPREMMKNVQGSSAGAGSGEFHVYKASRRREYERLKLLEEESQKEAITAEFERKKKEAEEAANSKTAKNRAKRQKKKERAKVKGSNNEEGSDSRTVEDADSNKVEAPIKKRRLVNGKELVFRRPGEDSDAEEEDERTVSQQSPESHGQTSRNTTIEATPIIDIPRITIHEDE